MTFNGFSAAAGYPLVVFAILGFFRVLFPVSHIFLDRFHQMCVARFRGSRGSRAGTGFGTEKREKVVF